MFLADFLWQTNLESHHPISAIFIFQSLQLMNGKRLFTPILNSTIASFDGETLLFDA